MADSMRKYVCATCGHAFYRHREHPEWQALNPRRKRNLFGCTSPGCDCQAAKGHDENNDN